MNSALSKVLKRLTSATGASAGPSVSLFGTDGEEGGAR